MLRATGREQEAAVVENRDLARALTVARAAAESESEEATVLAVEAERLLNASLLAEMLAPMLAERLHSSMSAAAPARAASVVAKTQDVVTPAAALPARSEVEPRRKEDGVPSIADLIDGMLSQEAPLPSPAGLR